ncbi:P-loop NTPase fold protein [Paenibacillus marinisediminis]
MGEFNQKIGNVINNIVDEASVVLNEVYNYIPYFIAKYNAILSLCLLVLAIVSLILSSKNKKFRVEKKQIVNLITHISMSCLFGYLMNLADIKNINELLTLYWSMGSFVLFIVLIVFIKEIIIYFKSLKKITDNLLKVYYIIGLTYIFTAISINNLIVLNDLLMIGMFIFGWYILQLLSLKSITEKVAKVNEESDVEIHSYEQLLPTRKQDYSDMFRILKTNNYDEPFAMVLNGDWGTGKTSLINVLSSKLTKNRNHIIFIQPMILDTPEKLMEYFFNQLKDILSSNGIFIGRDSPFKQYLNVIIQTINTLNLKQAIKLDMFLGDLDSKEPSDFRSSKKRLEEDIQKLLSSGIKENKRKKDGAKSDKSKIYIIVDDFDRVEEETFNSTLVFIKEIVNFNGITVVFLMDEKKIDGNKKINRVYLDKFVNKKFQLSKIDYQELFSYFIQTVDESIFINEWTQKIIKEIKKNIVVFITDLIKNISDQVDDIQKEIDSLSRNTSKNQHNIDTQLNDLIARKMEVKGYLQKLNDGISNVRRVKKIIREIKILLEAIDLQISEYETFKINLSKVEQIREIIVRVAIFKILFGEHVDKLIQQGDDFYNVMQDIKYLKNKNYLLNLFFSMFFRMSIGEEQGIKMDILNDFCNAIILNRSFDSLCVDKKTDSEIILCNLDNPNHSLNINSLEEVQAYLRVIMFNSYRINHQIVSLRIEKLVNHIMDMYGEEAISLKDLFELLGEAQRNPLLETDKYLSNIKEILDGGARFQNTKDKDVSCAYLNGVIMPLIVRYQNDTIMIINLLKLKDSKYTYESIREDFGDIYKFGEIVKAIKRIFKEENQSILDLDFFKRWVDKSIENIITDNQENKYVTVTIKHCEKNVNKFIRMYQLIEEIADKLRVTQVDPTYLFSEKLHFHSKEELLLNIHEFHNFICKQKNKMTWDYLVNLNRLLIYLESYSRTDQFKEEIIEKIIELYNSIPIDEYVENSDEERTWHWCSMKLGEVIENQKQLQESNE